MVYTVLHDEHTDIRNDTGRRCSRDSFKESVKRKHLVTKQDCYNQRKKLGWKTSRHTDDAISVNMLVNEFQLESYNLALVYKPQGVIDPMLPTIAKDGFVLALQFQRDVYRQYAHSVICIDSTHKTNTYDFKLVTLMVVDEYGEGIVVVCVHKFCLPPTPIPWGYLQIHPSYSASPL